MLDGLDDVDWASLEHAYGPAADVPANLRGLLAGTAEQRDRALGGLYGGICHQGTRYEASAPAVPFLLELIEDPATQGRAAILGLVAGLAVGQHETWLPDGFPDEELRAAAAGGAELLRDAPPPAEDDEDEDFEGDTRLDYWEAWTSAQRDAFAAYVDLAAYDAVGAGLPVLRDLLADGDAAVRAGAAFTLGWFPRGRRQRGGVDRRRRRPVPVRDGDRARRPRPARHRHAGRAAGPEAGDPVGGGDRAGPRARRRRGP